MTTSTPSLVPTLDFDHHSPFTANHRDEVLALVRRHPIFWTESNGGHWVATSYDLIKRILRDPATFSSLKTEEMTGGVTIPTVVGPRLIPAEVDAPQHRQLRKMLAPKFGGAAIKKIEPELHVFIEGVIDDVVAKGDFDLIHDIADRIPAGSIVAYLGFPEEERVPFIKSVQAALTVLPFASDPEFAASSMMQEGLTQFGHAVEVIQRLIAARRQAPQDDVVSHMLADEYGLSDDDVMWVTFTLIVGGAENPAAMIGNSLLHLSQDDALRARLIADPSLIPAACEELLRQTTSAVSLARNVIQDIELEGAQIKKGDRILLWLPAGNRDESMFDHPEVVDIDRPTCPHIAFGDGPHVCIGSGLFRTWYRMMLTEILTKMPNYSIDLENSVRFDDAATMWGWRTMPATTNAGRS